MLKTKLSLNSTEQRLVDASTAGDIDVVKCAFRRGEVTNNGKEKALLAASQSGRFEVVQFLLEDAELMSDEEMAAALQAATVNGHSKVVARLAAKMVDVDCLSSVWRDSFSYDPQPALFWAVQEGHMEVVKVLLLAGADIKKTCQNRRMSLLQVAAKAGRLEMVEFLLATLDQGASSAIAYTNTDGHSALHFAAYSKVDCKDVVELLLARGADPHLQTRFGETPLWCAAFARNSTACRALLEAGADVAARTFHGDSSLTSAIEMNWFEVAEVLLDFGADANEILNGLTALHLACGARRWKPVHPGILNLLLRHGANVHAVCAEGDTALHMAVRAGSPEAVSLLLAHGSSPHLRNNAGLRPMDVSLEKGHDNQHIILRLLERAIIGDGG